MFGRADLKNSSKKWEANHCQKRSTLKRAKAATRKNVLVIALAFPVANRNYPKTYFSKKRASEDFTIGGMSVT